MSNSKKKKNVILFYQTSSFCHDIEAESLKYAYLNFWFFITHKISLHISNFWYYSYIGYKPKT